MRRARAAVKSARTRSRPAPPSTLDFDGCAARHPRAARAAADRRGATKLVHERRPPRFASPERWGQKREAPACARAPWSTSSVSRVLFRSEVTRAAAANHSSRATVTGRLEQPTRGLGRAVLRRLLGDPRRRHARLRGLAPDGVCRAVSVTGDAVGSYPAVSPLPGERSRAGQAVFSLLHFPWRSRHRALPGIALCGARTFLPPRCRSLAGTTHDRRSPVRHRRPKHGPEAPATQGRPRARGSMYSWGQDGGPMYSWGQDQLAVAVAIRSLAARGRTRARSRTGRRRSRTCPSRRRPRG